jgi:hypothetical protein
VPTVKLLLSLLALLPTLYLAGCHGSAPGTPLTAAGRAARSSATAADRAALVLTREEVAAVLGKPVTNVDGSGDSLTYKTDVLQLETSIEVAESRDADDAIQAMQGARTATGLLGGKPEAIAALGDEAFFGAMSLLYLRKGDRVVTITPPNLQLVASMAAANKVMNAELGSEAQLKAMAGLREVEKTDALAVGVNSADATQGAMATIKAASTRNGSSYETDSRAMALALASKLVVKL